MLKSIAEVVISVRHYVIASAGYRLEHRFVERSINNITVAERVAAIKQQKSVIWPCFALALSHCLAAQDAYRARTLGSRRPLTGAIFCEVALSGEA